MSGPPDLQAEGSYLITGLSQSEGYLVTLRVTPAPDKYWVGGGYVRWDGDRAVWGHLGGLGENIVGFCQPAVRNSYAATTDHRLWSGNNWRYKQGRCVVRRSDCG